MQCAPMSIKWLQSPQVSLWGDSSGGTQVIQTLLTLAHRRNQNLPAVAIRSPLPSAFRLCIHCLLPFACVSTAFCLSLVYPLPSPCYSRMSPPPFQLPCACVSTAFSTVFRSCFHRLLTAIPFDQLGRDVLGLARPHLREPRLPGRAVLHRQLPRHGFAGPCERPQRKAGPSLL